MLVGVNRFTGVELKGPERAIQDIEYTLSTPLKSQPGKRIFGNELPSLISAPMVDDTIMAQYAALIDAVAWEPEAELIDFGLTDASETGRVQIWYRIKFLPTDEIVTSIIGKNEGETNV